jgi:hypothetical protein
MEEPRRIKVEKLKTLLQIVAILIGILLLVHTVNTGAVVQSIDIGGFLSVIFGTQPPAAQPTTPPPPILFH